MKQALFYTFLCIFSLTAALTLVGVAGYLPIRDGYLNVLFSSLLVELVGAMVAMFRWSFLPPKSSGGGRHSIHRHGGQNDVVDADIFAQVPAHPRTVRVLAVSSLQSIINAPLGSLLGGHPPALLQWLVLDPSSHTVEEWTRDHPSRTAQETRDHIHAAVDRLMGMAHRGEIPLPEVRVHRELPTFRLVFVDDVVFVRYYPKRRGTTRPRSVVFRKGDGWMYEAFEVYYESLWSHAQLYDGCRSTAPREPDLSRLPATREELETTHNPAP